MAVKRSPAVELRGNDCLEAALAYLGRGWSVIPIEARGKRPLVPWLEFQQRCADADEVRQWFETRKKANVAIVTGVVSDLVVLDIDIAHGGKESLRRLEHEHGALAETVEAVTGSGGRHFYFAHPGGVVRNRAGLTPGIDLRGDGGCVVAPPSVHRNGKRYRWKRGHAPGESDLSPMPAWLLGMVRGDKARCGHPLSYWRSLVREGVDEGQRNSTIASLAGHLFHRGIDEQVVLELLLTWNRARCRPPLSDHEVARVVESISRLHEREASREDAPQD
ncbi:MAG: bifunctional DNA primase/polymerase [Betaproteobacteria bacterium]|nr:MAG: bifunctional DNA primase/polymerase [Betaproteobacteria bacterium]